MTTGIQSDINSYYDVDVVWRIYEKYGIALV